MQHLIAVSRYISSDPASSRFPSLFLVLVRPPASASAYSHHTTMSEEITVSARARAPSRSARPDPDPYQPGDYVAVTHSGVRHEGVVVGAHIDYAGRQIVEVQLDAGQVYNAWYPTVTRVRRTVSYARPSPGRSRTIERRIYW
ncbi:hypothetical protein GGX14DRAFT_484508 [Mycena pura]|uniref:Uncharacterized protein n=1 Tax=Mycena pura TaxID=153505 RepID=A0AAD6USU7_9AGAR|nr:hypothetical protein GGX14DRAFT_484508 [Mycena pura]